MKFRFLLLSLSFLLSCYASSKKQMNEANIGISQSAIDLQNLDKAYFASGCFWCVEAIFESVNGVHEVVSGYAGGSKSDANYKDVSNGVTKHTESVEVYYDPKIVDYNTLVKVFFGSHDPTTLNRQGPDRGTQYRSAIFYLNQEEKDIVDQYVAQLYQQEEFPSNSITTEISPFEAFYPAEDYHQNYEANNPNQPYVRSVSVPRLNRFKAKFPELLKDGLKH